MIVEAFNLSKSVGTAVKRKHFIRIVMIAEKSVLTMVAVAKRTIVIVAVAVEKSM